MALLRAYDPTLTPAQIRDRIINTGDPVAALEGMLDVVLALLDEAAALP